MVISVPIALLSEVHAQTDMIEIRYLGAYRYSRSIVICYDALMEVNFV